MKITVPEEEEGVEEGEEDLNSGNDITLYTPVKYVSVCGMWRLELWKGGGGWAETNPSIIRKTTFVLLFNMKDDFNC